MIRSLVLGLLVLYVSQAAVAVEIFKWNRVPLPIQLGVGHERIIFVDRNVSVGVPRSLTDRLRIQSVAGAVYLLANEQVPPTRLQLRDDESGEIILLDIATVDSPKPLEPAKIVTVDPAAEAASNSASAERDGAPQSPPSRTPAPVALTRYAAQMMYAPLRTVEPLPGVRQVPVRLSGQLSTLAPALDVDAVATGAWSLGKWTVTAIRLSNRRPDSLNLDPRHLQGDLYSAAFQHRYLGPRGSADDTTTVYVITLDKGLDVALVPAPVATGERDNDEHQ